MFAPKFCLYVLSLTGLVTGDFYKNILLLPQFWASDEASKNQLDNVHITNRNMPIITKDLMAGMESVQKLEIQSCGVQDIEQGSFGDLHLRRLSLKHNLLKHVKNNVFSGLSLEDLDLSDNFIEVVEEEAFNNMRNLRTIKLSNNKIETYDSRWFMNTPHLCRISLENNLITSLPAKILSGERLCYVDFMASYNRIQRIDEDAFSGISRFYRLYLDHNDIMAVEAEMFSGVQEIADLKLNNNRITCIRDELKKVRRCDASFNPWDPECLREFVMKRNAIQPGY